MALTIRPLDQSDRAEWRRLWTAYQAFYERVLPDEVFESTWQRLFDNGAYEPKCLVAELDGRVIGLTHYLFHRNCSAIANNCYLQDLYADPHVRGTGVGRALIEAVYAKADEAGTANVYWTTQHFNENARKLYDRVATLTPFIKYQRT